MKLFRYWKLIAAFLSVFLAGVVSGGVATNLAIRRALADAMIEQKWAQGVVGHLQAKLGLSPEQHARIQSVVDASGGEFKALFKRMFDDFGHAIVRLQHRVDAELTPAQRTVHAAMKAEFRQSLKDHFNLDLPADSSGDAPASPASPNP